jgi:hypothetical protein
VPPKIDGADTPDDETLAWEAQVVRRVVGSVSEGLDQLVTAILAAFEAARINAGGTLSDAQAREFGNAIADRLVLGKWPPMRTALAQAARESHDLGVQRAARRFRDADDRAKAASTKTPRNRKVPNPDTALRKELSDAAKIARSGIKTQTDAAAVAGKVKAGKARIEGHARYVANEGINAGTLDVARTMELRVMWVAERNACLHCLAHAGWVVEPGDLFPGVSFDPAATNIPSVGTCPLHPNCRCQLRTTDAPAGKPPSDRSSLSPAARLAAEARRSVVYQWTDHASGPAAARAAEALLRAGAGLPASVEARARRALKQKKK